MGVYVRVNNAWLRWRHASGILCDRRKPEKLKSKIYKTVVRPVALYSAECWPSTLKHDRMLHAMEMRMLRWSLGVTRRDRVRNDDIRGRLGVAPITKKIWPRH